ncbi:MAG: CpsD/CapB family tyrosine-protein kinase [Syntrophaceae bacterium]|nr:CpsD/CapB family tyrosine-protein kinase [Syntrophaceae bacterium]
MNSWEDAYSKNKEGEKISVDPGTDQEQSMPDTSGQQKEGAGSTSSYEELYYRQTGEPLPQASLQPANQQAETHKPRPAAPAPDWLNSAQHRFIPRPVKLTITYPALLEWMRNALSDCWANILVETKQAVSAVLVSGAARNEGATFISYHLAMFLAKEFNMKVLYVDTNLDRPGIPRTQNLPGVYSYLSEGKGLSSLIVQTEYPGFYLLPSGAGKVAKNISGNMLTRGPLSALMDFCRNNFAVTIIDGQPLTSSPAMIECARLVDMTLLVCRYGHSRQEVSKLAIEKLQMFGVTSIGVILNDRKFPVPQKLYQRLG